MKRECKEGLLLLKQAASPLSPPLTEGRGKKGQVLTTLFLYHMTVTPYDNFSSVQICVIYV